MQFCVRVTVRMERERRRRGGELEIHHKRRHSRSQYGGWTVREKEVVRLTIHIPWTQKNFRNLGCRRRTQNGTGALTTRASVSRSIAHRCTWYTDLVVHSSTTGRCLMNYY